MKKLLAIAVAALAVATPAFAGDNPLSGAWRLSAKVASVPFNLICRFERMGDNLGGSCMDSVHHKDIPLTAVHVDGDHVTFKHAGHFLLKTFDVNYAGVVEGDKISGQIDVFGHTGDFVAVREGS